MQIENNILKYYLQNVYFITGTAYAGKSTAAKMLAEKYGMILCGENYHAEVADRVADPAVQPDLCYMKQRKLGRFCDPAAGGVRALDLRRFRGGRRLRRSPRCCRFPETAKSSSIPTSRSRF